MISGKILKRFVIISINCYSQYILDISYYYTSPGLSWDAFLKYTDEYYMKTYKKHFEIELITDMDMYLFIESSICGGYHKLVKG